MIVIATSKDIPALVKLINSAYRGESSKVGWTTEADLLGGQRTDAETLQRLMDTPGATILKAVDENQQIEGCVYLKKQGERLYLGLLTVSPPLQARGVGKKLLAAAETQAKAQQCSYIKMTVISIRKELIEWYERHGYHDTGSREPFPVDPAFGIPNQPLEFIVMEKRI